jgi:histidinol dehydrogenase
MNRKEESEFPEMLLAAGKKLCPIASFGKKNNRKDLSMEIITYAASRQKIDRIVNRGMRTDPAIIETVKRIVSDVKERGDDALAEYSATYDRFDMKKDGIIVTGKLFAECYEKTDKELIAIIEEAGSNIRSFHSRQVEKTWLADFPDGVRLGQKITPLERVAVYVPGGKAFYPSTALMNIIPAQVAGVGDIMVLTPPGRFMDNPVIGATLHILGIERAFLVGGAHAVAAAAFGTRTVPRADKIVGPGNIYVATAKREVFGYVDIDMIAGPSEVVVLASSSANPKWVALDLLSQAEHRTGYESAILVTDSSDFAKKVNVEIEAALTGTEHEAVIRNVLADYGAIIVTNDIMEGVELVNRIAPEHLEIVVDDEEKVLARITNAGAIFVGAYSSEPVGDYWAGPNHVLPTGGTARFFSPLGVYDFVKRSSLIYYTKEAIVRNANKINTFAAREELLFHGKAVLARYADLVKRK